MAGQVEETVPFDVFVALTDTDDIDPRRVSSIATALREARELVGRNPQTGRVADRQRGATWAGALVYLIYCEQIGSCFRPAGHPHRPRRGKALEDALVWFGGFSVDEADDLGELRNRLAHDYTLRGAHDNSRVFFLHGGAHEPVVHRDGQAVMVGLPALALRIEMELNKNLLVLVGEDKLVCHHRNGLAGVPARFWMATLGPDDPPDDPPDDLPDDLPE